MPHLQKKNGLKARPPVPGRPPFQYSHPSPERLDLTVRPEGRVERSAPLWPWVLATVVGVWMFGLGVVVGRHSVPVEMGEDLALELETLRAQEVQADQERMEQVSEELASISFAFYDALAEGDAGVPPPPPRVPTEPVEVPEGVSRAPDHPPEIKRVRVKKRPPAEGLASEDAASEPARPAAKPAREKAVQPAVSAPKPDPETILAPSRVSQGQYAVQVASFAVRADAERLASGLKDRGYPGTYVSDEPGPQGAIRFRVKIGHYRTYADAQELLGRLKSRERIHDAFVSRR